MSDLRFLKIHINYLTAAPILEILLEPEAVANPFSFYSSMESYIAYYRQAFLQSYRLRKGGEVGGKLRYPFVKGLGELLPLAGHEVKNLPLFRALGGNVSYVLGSLKSEGGMLPMKLFPNWKIGLDPNIHEDYELLTKFNCSPLVRIYPYGIASYQIKTSLVSERGIDLEKLITLMRSITDQPLFATHRGKFNASSLARRFHEIILSDFLIQAHRREDLAFSPIHRIVTISSIDGKLSPDSNRKELAAMVGLEPRWSRLSKSYVEKHLGRSFEGLYEDQFFFFHPSCAIIYPSSPAEKPEFDSYVKRCLRSNFSSIVETATLQSQLASALGQPLRGLLDEAPYSLERKAELQVLLDRIRGAEWLLNGSWALRLKGAHEDFFHVVEEMIGLEGRAEKALNTLKELDLNFKR
jgi:hypothetical protein